MDPIQIDKLRVHPEEINQTTGRIRINLNSQDNPSYITRPLRATNDEEIETKGNFGDFHRIWIPFLILIGFIIVGVIFFISYQRIESLEKKMIEITTLQNKSQKELNESIERFKTEINQDKIPPSAIKELKTSLKDLETKTQTLQKKVESLNFKEVLILESEKDEIPFVPATKTVPSAPAPKNNTP